MKKNTWFAIASTTLLLCVLCGSGFAQGPTVSELLQRGIYLQETVGDLDGAIKIYRQITRMAQESRANAAQAEYRLAICLQKKGQQNEAMNTLHRLVREYPDQADVLVKARLVIGQEPIVIWRVGSPYRPSDLPGTSIPADLARGAEKLGRKLDVQAFPAEGFARTFHNAFNQHQEPDVLVFDNYGIIDGLSARAFQTPGATAFPGIGSDIKVSESLIKTTHSLARLAEKRLGWQFLLSTSRNHEAAKSLALRRPECNLSGSWLPVPKELEAVAATLAADYIEEKNQELKPLEDADRLNTEAPESRSREVTATRECGYLGNGHLAFLPMVVGYQSPRALGWIELLLVMRKQQDEWRLLAASTDPISNGIFTAQIPTLANLISKTWTSGSQPDSAKSLTPAADFPEPPPGERFGSFNWQPSGSAGLVAEIVEFAYNNDARFFVKFHQADVSDDSQISAAKIGMTNGLWKWRVWSISDAGSVSFSEARLFMH
jgi:tetratricopeptide (TPR) repeat protein